MRVLWAVIDELVDFPFMGLKFDPISTFPEGSVLKGNRILILSLVENCIKNVTAP